MTGIYVRVYRDMKWQSVDFATLSEKELREYLRRRKDDKARRELIWELNKVIRRQAVRIKELEMLLKKQGDLPLKFEEIKNHPLVWDSKYGEWQYVFFRNGEWWYYLFADDNPYYFKFEENRFYKKEVSEDEN